MYADHDPTPFPYGELVTYVLSTDEAIRLRVERVYPATVTFVHTPLSVNLQVTVTTPGTNVQTTLTPQHVSFGTTPGCWYPGPVTNLPTALPAGLPW